MWLELYIAYTWTSVILLFLFGYFFKHTNEKIIDYGISSQLSIIIPFRNEENRIKKLLDSLDQQSIQPKQIIFVNDHSDDGTVKLIEEWKKSHSESSILSLTDAFGKKRAIELGVQYAETTFILTLDADVWFHKDFLAEIALCDQVSMYVRPVIFEESTILSKIFNLEHLFFGSLNDMLFSFYPLSASGANLIFKKKAYVELNQLDTHADIASGDDYFLLRNFQDNNLEVLSENKWAHAVYTVSPLALKEYLQQRVRWIGKTLNRSTIAERLVSIFVFMYVMGGFCLLMYFMVIGDFNSLFYLFMARLLLDTFIFLWYAIPLKIAERIIFLPLMQLIYPVLMFIILIASLIIKPTWKGRALNK